MIRLISTSVIAICLTMAPSWADEASLDSVIADYEAFTIASDPDSAADVRNERPRSWGDVTPAAVAQRAASASEILATLDALDLDRTSPEVAILHHLLQGPIDAHLYDTARIPFTGDWGFYAQPRFAARYNRLQSTADAEAWIDRLNDVPRYFQEHTANMRRGIATGWTAHEDPLATSIEQVRDLIKDDVTQSALFAPLAKLPADMDPVERARLQSLGILATENAMSAYRDLLDFFETEYAPAARPEPGIVTLPGGREVYEAAIADHTAGSGYSAEDIHALGQDEVARIRANMEAIIAELGFEGSFEDFTTFLRTDPQFYAETPEDLLEKASEMAKRLDAILPRYFGKLPRLPYGVEAVPAAIAPGYTTGRYADGDMDEGVAGTYWVNTYALDQRPLYELPALSAHEAVPGHHLQISLAQELVNVPDFRRSYYATAFGEGWGLYSEKLAGEAGFYRTPYERFGQLSYEMWRACRLVADTGLHYYGWSRAEAEACFIDNTALAPLNIQTEVTRYIGWPGQATAYKVGELKILALRAAAKDALGEDFDIRAFHDHLLGAGAMPLDALEARMTAWTQAQLVPAD